MSLDVLNSKEIDIKCKSLEANDLVITNLEVDNLILPTNSDKTIIEHDFIDGQGAETRIKRGIKQHVLGETYVQNAIVFILVNYGSVAVEVYYIAVLLTSGTPGVSADWGVLGSIFNKEATYVLNDSEIMYEGFEYQCLTTTTPGAVFNPAQWTLIGLAHNELGDSTILESITNATETTITFGRNSKDINGMLKLFSPANNFESELIIPTGNLVLEPPTPYRDTTPNSFFDRAIINYDLSQNFVFRKSRTDSTDISGRVMFISYDKTDNTSFEMCSIRERNITGVVAPFGELHTELVSSCGYTVRDFSPTATTHGTATLLAGGTVTVATTACGPNSHIFLQLTVITGTAGFLRVSAKTQTNFTVLSSAGAADGSTFDWLIINPNFTP
jgi:hypothetical protein